MYPITINGCQIQKISVLGLDFLIIIENTSSECLSSIEEQYKCQEQWEKNPEMLSIIMEDVLSNEMIGDVNITPCPVEELWQFSLSVDLAMELQVMIGDPHNRRMGFAKEALSHLISHIGMCFFNI